MSNYKDKEAQMQDLELIHDTESDTLEELKGKILTLSSDLTRIRMERATLESKNHQLESLLKKSKEQFEIEIQESQNAYKQLLNQEMQQTLEFNQLKDSFEKRIHMLETECCIQREGFKEKQELSEKRIQELQNDLYIKSSQVTMLIDARDSKDTKDTRDQLQFLTQQRDILSKENSGLLNQIHSIQETLHSKTSELECLQKQNEILENENKGTLEIKIENNELKQLAEENSEFIKEFSHRMNEKV